MDVDDTPVSTRRIFHTLLDWAGVDAATACDRPTTAQEIVLGEAMKPFLEYGWQPQVMAVAGPLKAILAGTIEVYDLAADPGETRNLGSARACRRRAQSAGGLPRAVAGRRARAGEPRRRGAAAPGEPRLHRLERAPVVRKDAPRPADMMPLLAKLEKASGLFAAGQFAEAIPLLEDVLAADPFNLDAALRLATAHSSLGHEQKAVDAVPAGGRDRAEVAGRPDLPRAALRADEGVGARRAAARAGGGGEPGSADGGRSARGAPGAAGAAGDGRGADDRRGDRRFERARALQPAAFKNDLELGVLYLAARRYPEATHRARPRARPRIRPTRWRSSSARR